MKSLKNPDPVKNTFMPRQSVNARVPQQAATALQLSELRYRRLFETAQEGILIIDAVSGKIIDANPFIEKLLGYSKPELVAKELWEIGVFKDIEDSKLAFRQLQAKKYIRYENLPLQTKGGRTIDVEFVSNVYLVGDQSVIQCDIRDITDRIRAEKVISDRTKELEYLTNSQEKIKKAILNVLEDLEAAKAQIEREKVKDEAMLRSIGDGVVVVDRDLKTMLINKAAEAATGWSSREVLGKIWLEVIALATEDGKPVLPSKPSSFFAIQEDGATPTATYLYTRKNKTKFPAASTVSPVRVGGKIIGFVLVFRNVTREREIDKAKTEFVSLASHQLRTPLSTINWYSEMLLSEDVGALTPKQRQYIHEVYHASRRMVNLVNALLNVSRLELGTMMVKPELVNIIELAKTAIKELGPQIKKKKLLVRQKYDKNAAVVKVDPKLIAIIFQNLLSNSVKYTKNGGRIGLTISQTQAALLITVSDNGVGIPKDQQKDIFTKLFRADNAKTIDPDGTGLGLYIIKEIIDYTDGAVWFESSEGKGTTFYVRLPRSGMFEKAGSKELITEK